MSLGEELENVWNYPLLPALEEDNILHSGKRTDLLTAP